MDKVVITMVAECVGFFFPAQAIQGRGLCAWEQIIQPTGIADSIQW